MDEMRLYYLVERAVGNQLSAEERSELDAWLAEGEANRVEYAEIAEILGFGVSAMSALAPDTDAEWQALQGKLPQGKAPDVRVIRPPFWSGARVWAAAAAAVVLVTVGSYFAFFKADAGSYLGVTYATAAGEHKAYKLPDGSVVTLQGGSKILTEHDFGDQDRQIELVGEAYFDVAKDRTRPFIVKAGATRAEALGTEFNVRMRLLDNLIVLSVTEGKVKFTGSPKEEMTLVAGEVATYDPYLHQITKEDKPAEEEAAWKEGKLVFTDTPLHEAIARIQAHYGVQIDYPDRLVQARLTATFDRKPLQGVLDVLEAIYSLKSTQNGKSVRLSE